MSRNIAVRLVMVVAIAAAAVAVACGEDRGGPLPTPAAQPAGATPEASPQPPLRYGLQQRPGVRLDGQVLEEVARAYAEFWSGTFNALANANPAFLEEAGVGPQAQEPVRARIAALERGGQRLLVRSTVQMPMVTDAGEGWVVLEDSVDATLEVLASGQQPGQGATQQETWRVRLTVRNAGGRWQVTEAEIGWPS